MPPLNGSGSYSAPASTWNPAVNGTTINSTDWAALLADITTALSTALYKDGQATPTANIPMGGFKLTGLAAGSATGNSLRYEQLFTTSAVALLGAMDWVKGADVASAATTNLTTATGNAVHITGTTTITAVTLGSGMWRLVIFDGALTLTHHATNNNLPGGANITTIAGDRALYWSDGTTVYCITYIPVAGGSVPFTDTNPIVMGSADKTKKIRFEVDGLTTGTTRVLTVADIDSAIGKQPTRQVFLSGSGTYNTPAGATRINVRSVGGGAGGSGNAAAAATGGGNTTFGTLTASGGAAGSAAAGGAGGAAANGDINIPGGSGGGGEQNGTAGVFPQGGHGGVAAFGGAGAQGVGNANGGNGATNSGSGGGGGGGSSGGNSGGGGGAGGYVEKLITAPSASYSYGVGAGGAGSAGAATTGGTGAAGIIIVDEYYN